MTSLLHRACVCAIACLLLIVGSQLHADATQPSVDSVFDGAFTSEQSARGKARYLDTCERCHKENLSGDLAEEVPPLVGDAFLSEWAEWTVGDLFEFFTEKMPPKRKDRIEISDQHYIDVLAYILEQNGFPAGETELVPEMDPLLEIEMSPGE